MVMDIDLEVLFLSDHFIIGFKMFWVSNWSGYIHEIFIIFYLGIRIYVLFGDRESTCKIS